MNYTQIGQVLRGWYLIEMLTPQTLKNSWFEPDQLDDDVDNEGETAKRSSKPLVISATIEEHAAELPWEQRQVDAPDPLLAGEDVLAESVDDEELVTDDPDAAAYTAFIGIVQRSVLYEILYQALELERDHPVEPKKERVALAAIDLTEDGRLLPETLRISTLPWYASRIQDADLASVLSRPVSADFATFSISCRKRCGVDSKDPASAQDIRALARFVRDACGVRDLSIEFAAVIQKLTGDPNDTRDLLNSFYHEDLADAIDNADERRVPPVVNALFQKPDVRKDVRKNGVFFAQACSKHSVLPSAWPNDGVRLALMQHVALVASRSADAGRILAVNGPPGTGKTTLIRSFVAQQIVERATRLAEFETPANAWQAMREDGTARGQIYQIDPRLAGFEMIVASANNEAIENITRDLPKEKSVGAFFSELREIAYFIRTSDHIANCGSARKIKDVKNYKPRHRPQNEKDERTCGLFCAILGRKANRTKFADLVLGPSRHKDDWFATISQEVAESNVTPWLEAVSEFGQARVALKVLVDKLETTDACWSIREPHEKEVFAPFDSEDIFQAQVAVFLAALRLTKSFIINSWSQMWSNLQIWKSLLLSPTLFEGTAPERTALWQAAFLLTPVMSTTFASARRMFYGMPSASLGIAIIDESGQAIPQAAIGLLAQTQRAIFVGDPLQLEPIVTLPDAIVERIAASYGNDLALYPTTANGASLQTIAESASVYGTTRSEQMAEGEQFERIIGVPLLAHRRCLEPMFSIANHFYNNTMVSATRVPDDLVPRMALGSSCWIDERGRVRAENTHAVRSQVDLAFEIILRHLTMNDKLHLPPPDIAVITPFRETALEIKGLLRAGGPRLSKYIKRVGTVHTFQGKEADIVLFVLGLDERRPGAVKFASGRINLLNVAVTRAKYRLYVIGNLNLWGAAGPFANLSTALAGENTLTVDEFRQRSTDAFAVPVHILADAERTIPTPRKKSPNSQPRR